MSIAKTRKVSWSGNEISQAANTEHATGTFHFTDPKTGTKIETTSLGLLQTADNWATFTGRARTSPNGEDKAILVIIDLADPLTHTATMSVDMEDGYHASVPATNIKLSVN